MSELTFQWPPTTCEHSKPLLNRFGNDPKLSIIVFTLDETSYSRELAPLAGHYPALRLGPASGSTTVPKE